MSIDADGNFVGEGDIKAQVRQIYDNMGQNLESAGASFANVVPVHDLHRRPRDVADFLEERTKIIENRRRLPPKHPADHRRPLRPRGPRRGHRSRRHPLGRRPGS